MDLSITSVDNPTAMTLMSADVEKIVQGFRNLHELWANLISVGIATYLLEQELGAACAAPVIVALICGGIVFGLSGSAARRQQKWMKSIEARVKVTSAMLSSMKGTKMAGLSDKLAEIIQEFRIHELHAAKQFRQLLVYTLAISFTPQNLVPVVTFSIFVIISRTNGTKLDTDKMFTSLSLFSLLTTPLSQVFQQIPTFVAGVGCFQRIQEFLNWDKNFDSRVTTRGIPQTCIHIGTEKEKQPELERSWLMTTEAHAIVIYGGSFGWHSSEPNILQDINLTIEKSKITLLIGPVASGKSTLLKAVLAETPLTKGFIYVSTKAIAFCDQTPWLKNDTIEANIRGFSDFDVEWYNAVKNACGLEEDIATFPSGDQTVIGSNGVSLSGGQRQRVAIARAVYSKKRIILLDDVFSGMDSNTAHMVSTRLLGAQGILRSAGVTVVVATHTVNLLPLADHIIALDLRGKIAEQGTLEELRGIDGYVKSFGIKQNMSTVSAPLEASPNSSTLGSQAVWLKWWGDASDTHQDADNGKYLGVYWALAVMGVSFLGLMVREAFMVMGINAGVKLHQRILSTVTSAPIALFSTVDTGILLNRFTQDIGIVDDSLPMAILNFAASFFSCVGTTVLISTATAYVALCYPVILILLYFIQKFYLRTSRQLRVMDIEAKSPLYTQYLESLAGLPTIRAFGWQHFEQDINFELVNTSQQPFYLMLMVQRWLTLVLELISVGLILIITGLAVGTRHSVSTGFTGVSLVNIVNLSVSLQSLITWWTVLENSLGAVARIKNFCEVTEPEPLPHEVNKPPKEWPGNGNVEFKNISVSYKRSEKDVLHEISLVIKPGEKIGICGRSGSGKSSLILALFRMIEWTSGTIVVDGLDLSNVPQQDIRLRLNAVPQDPYFIVGTVHLNLDPYQTTTEIEAIHALSKVGLWQTCITSLDVEMKPNELSYGQRQLFCLARAILRKGKIVVLDEATSSVDRKTDALMQRLIREEFKNHTIIAVAHRLDTILDFDRLVVLQEGCIKECDTPLNLLQREGSAFRALYKTYAPSEDDTGADGK
ncbi:putative abc multidrug transporter [Phaeomoniella chlamydospora]|uniref:Putative abc multidrug transporter n=1 Tax=Phaeomoniella chlamydospora TaxID=158046 RepID=A0A0G2DYU8_PHACM|nr:putative abc multidrug transporter [Phaeomoniella chlamydospora]